MEGYATGMSLRDCLNALRMRYRIHVSFSSGNLKKLAARGLVVADVEEAGTGVVAAQATGLSYFTTDLGDFNDLHKKVGTFRSSQEPRRRLEAQGLDEEGCANAEPRSVDGTGPTAGPHQCHVPVGAASQR